MTLAIRPIRLSALSVLLSAMLAGGSGADNIQPPPSKDNTLIEIPNTNSNGSGLQFFVGKTSTMGLRRGLLAFNLTGIPASATITNVTLTLKMSATAVGNQTVVLHRALADWGEAASVGMGGGAPAMPGDATWLYRFYNTDLWATPGGDFAAAVSASQTVGAVGTYQWTDPGMVTDVQYWVNNPTFNFGWLLQGPESGGTSTKAFDSREGTVPPVLDVTYTLNTSGVGGGSGVTGADFSAPWPVPAQGAVNLAFALPHAAHVRLAIHDVAGRLVRQLVSGVDESAGPHTIVWDGRVDSGNRASAGIYIARLMVDGAAYERRVPLVR